MNIPALEFTSVKVMRSHDYCHFEICLGSNQVQTLEQVDELRKSAARLADKAVEQYKLARRNAELMMRDESGLANLSYRHREMLGKSLSELNPEEKAIAKAFADRARRARLRYNYDDLWYEPNYAEEEEF